VSHPRAVAEQLGEQPAIRHAAHRPIGRRPCQQPTGAAANGGRSSRARQSDRCTGEKRSARAHVDERHLNDHQTRQRATGRSDCRLSMSECDQVNGTVTWPGSLRYTAKKSRSSGTR
jgi:hypothetical protein